jgi:ACS family hexuronate transporter-like MFS transporter
MTYGYFHSCRQSGPEPSHGVGRFRWVICTLLLFGVTKNYMDRLIIGLLKTTLQHDLAGAKLTMGI